MNVEQLLPMVTPGCRPVGAGGAFCDVISPPEDDCVFFSEVVCTVFLVGLKIPERIPRISEVLPALSAVDGADLAVEAGTGASVYPHEESSDAT